MDEHNRLAQDIDIFFSSVGMKDYETYIRTADWQQQFPVFLKYGDIMLSSIHRMLADAAAAYPQYGKAAHALVARLENYMPNLAGEIVTKQEEPTPLPTIKMEGVDVLETLKAILNMKPTSHRTYDFASMQEAIIESSQSENLEDGHLIWLSYTYGNVALRERDVFLTGTPANSTFFEVGCQPGDETLAYIVDVSGFEDGKVLGDVYTADYKAYTQHIRECALPLDTVTLVPADGANIPEGKVSYYDYKKLHYRIDGYESMRYNPKSEKQLRAALNAERRERNENSAPGRLEDHLKDLSEAMTRAEAKQLTIELAALEKPNSTDGKHYLAELNPDLKYSGNQMLSALAAHIPYKGVTIGKVPGINGIYAIVPQEKMIKRAHDRAEQAQETNTLSKVVEFIVQSGTQTSYGALAVRLGDIPPDIAPADFVESHVKEICANLNRRAEVSADVVLKGDTFDVYFHAEYCKNITPQPPQQKNDAPSVLRQVRESEQQIKKDAAKATKLGKTAPKQGKDKER